jgi:thiamine biosynthesis lipoprotein
MEAAVSRAMEIEKNVKRDLNFLRAKAKNRKAVVPGDDLWFILNFAMETRHGTAGTFEVTMGEVEKLWRSTAKERKKPARRKIKALRRAAGMNHLEINKEGSVRLLRAQLPIDIDGLGRGYTLDGMADVLYGLGCQGFFIQAGEMAIVGDLPEKAKEKWKYKRPIFADGVKKIKETSIWNSAVVTTCPNPLFKKYGDTFYDLVDPVTGNLIRHNSIVTVEAASAMHAYAWALSLTINYDQDFYQWVTEQDTRVWYSEP